MGYVGYSSDGYKNDSVAMGPFDSVKNAIKTITQAVLLGNLHAKALRDAGNMLANTKWTQKVIVLLTDGVPHFFLPSQQSSNRNEWQLLRHPIYQ